MAIVAPPAPKFDFQAASPVGELEQALTRLASLTMTEPPSGKRHISLWGVASDLFRAGLSLDTVRELCLAINRQWSNPKTDEEVTAAVVAASSRLSG